MNCFLLKCDLLALRWTPVLRRMPCLENHRRRNPLRGCFSLVAGRGVRSLSHSPAHSVWVSFPASLCLLSESFPSVALLLSQLPTLPGKDRLHLFFLEESLVTLILKGAELPSGWTAFPLWLLTRWELCVFVFLALAVLGVCRLGVEPLGS